MAPDYLEEMQLTSSKNLSHKVVILRALATAQDIILC